MKKRCKICFEKNSAKDSKCKHCGNDIATDFSQPINEALPICSVIDRYIIGIMTDTNRNSITYAALDTKKDKKVYLQEFFCHGYMKRAENYLAESTIDFYDDIVMQEKNSFIKNNKKLIYANGTVYAVITSKKKIKKEKQKDSTPFHCTMRSIIGKRANQEDAADIIYHENGLLALLCDGMGGISSGEIASSECIRKIQEISCSAEHCDYAIIPDILHRKIVEADSYISGLQDMNKNPLGCGTTLLCVLIREDKAFFASVGDSHIYLIRDNSIILLNEEHNYFSDLLKKVEEGEIDYSYAVSHPKKDALTSYVGIGNIKKIHIGITPVFLNDGDVILLCSDGLYRALSDEEILSIVTSYSSNEDASDALIHAVEEKNLPRQDNTTFILFKYSLNDR